MRSTGPPSPVAPPLALVAPGGYLVLCSCSHAADLQAFRSACTRGIGKGGRKGQLIHTGFFKYTRNPNYLGELLIYLGFSILAMHWAPLAAIGLFIVVIWVPNMIKKDRSLSRYEQFEHYKRRTKLLIPFIL